MLALAEESVANKPAKMTPKGRIFLTHEGQKSAIKWIFDLLTT